MIKRRLTPWPRTITPGPMLGILALAFTVACSDGAADETTGGAGGTSNTGGTGGAGGAGGEAMGGGGAGITWPAEAFPLEVPGGGSFVGNMRPLANGDVLALGRGGGVGAALYRIGPDGSVELMYERITEGGCAPNDVAVTPDERYAIVTDSCGSLNRIDLSNDMVRTEYFTDTTNFTSVGSVEIAPADWSNFAGKALSSFGGSEWFTGPQTFIDAIDVETKSQLNLTANIEGRVMTMRVIDDGAALLVLSSTMAIDVQENGAVISSALDRVAPDKTVTRVAEFPSLMFDGMAIAPDGDTVYLVSPREGVGTIGDDIEGTNALYRLKLSDPTPVKLLDVDGDLVDDVAPTGIVTDGLSLLYVLDGRIEQLTL